MTDRQTQEFTTPLGNKVVLYSYLTGREVAAIKGILFSSVKMSMTDFQEKKMDMQGLSGDLLAQQERKTLDFLIVSFNGSTEQPVEKLLDLPASEYEAVLEVVAKIKDPTC